MAGESAQQEYERLRHRRVERNRRARTRILLLVAVAFAAGWMAPIVFISAVMSVIESAAGDVGPAITVHRPPAPVSMLAALLFAVGTAVNLLAPSHAERAWGKGAHGERIVGAALTEVSAERSVTVLDDRRMPRSRANIDHVAITPVGVFTIDAKHYEGRLEVRGRGQELWIGGRNRSKLLEQARGQTDAVQRVLSTSGLEAVPVTPMLCFVGTQLPRLFPPTSAQGVLLTTPSKLGGRLLEGDATLDASRRSEVARVLKRALPPAGTGSASTQRKEDQQAAHPQDEEGDPSRSEGDLLSHPVCDRCGAVMVVRQRRSDGASFLGCSAFPRCRNSLPLPDPT